jgi:hypothetical protein
VFVGLAYPKILLLQALALHPGDWSVQDPVVGIFTFIPGIRTLRYELFHNVNLLWSNLRGAGLPLLANDIQAAPLFPLTLLLLGLPDKIYWDVFVVVRLVGIGWATFLIASRMLGFRRLGAAVFTLCFAYSLYVLRYLNHPWQNGFLAGLWYLYFIFRLQAASVLPFRSPRGGLVLALFVCVYSLLTCGFPEAAAFAATLSLLVYLPFFVSGLARRAVSIRPFLGDLALAHVMGFALASPQLFSMMEFVASEGDTFRAGLGQYQIPSFQIFIGMLTRFADGPPRGSIIHLFHLTPLFLFFWGLGGAIARRRLNAADTAALLCGTFAVLKLFPVWPAFNQFIGSLPVLRHSWFIVYFFPLVLWTFAHFAAKGAEELFAMTPRSPATFPRSLVAILAALLVWAVVAEWQRETVNYTRAIKLIGGFSIFLALVIYRLSSHKPTPRWVGGLLIFLIAGEIITARRADFGRGTELVGANINEQKMLAWGEKNNRSRLDYRDQDQVGNGAKYGIATIDTGATAVLPRRAKALRTTLFNFVGDNAMGPYLPIDRPKFEYSWHLTSAGFSFVGPTNAIRFDAATLSRAYVPARCHVSADLEVSRRALATPSRFTLGDVWIEGLGEYEKTICRAHISTIKQVSVTSDRGASLQLQTVSGPAILVLNDNYYDGWHAFDTASDRELKIFPANVAFRAVFLPETRPYELRFIYRPMWLTPALLLAAVSALTALGLGLYILWPSGTRGRIYSKSWRAAPAHAAHNL